MKNIIIFFNNLFTCGITSNQVSTLRISNPSNTAFSISFFDPYLNHKVNNRNVSCKLSL